MSDRSMNSQLDSDQRNILVTGGAGFIGANFIRLFFSETLQQRPSTKIINLDALTYAGNLQFLSDLEKHANYSFVKADIRELKTLEAVFREFAITDVIHFAAESHVDNSIAESWHLHSYQYQWHLPSSRVCKASLDEQAF